MLSMLSFALSVVLGVTTIAQGQMAPNPVKPKFEFRLQKKTVLAGEPIIAEFAMVNTDKKNAVRFVPRPFFEFGRVSIFDENGKPIKKANEYIEPVNLYSQFGFVATPTLKPGEENKAVFVANRYYMIRKPGKYRIRFEAYETAGEVMFFKEDDHSKTPKIVQELTVTVKPIWVYPLQRMADRWVEQAARTPSPEQTLALQALFAMPEDVVGEHWRKLASIYVPGSTLDIKKELFRLHTPFTLGILQGLSVMDLGVLEEMQAKAKAEREAREREKFIGLPHS